MEEPKKDEKTNNNNGSNNDSKPPVDNSNGGDDNNKDTSKDISSANSEAVELDKDKSQEILNKALKEVDEIGKKTKNIIENEAKKEKKESEKDDEDKNIISKVLKVFGFFVVGFCIFKVISSISQEETSNEDMGENKPEIQG